MKRDDILKRLAEIQREIDKRKAENKLAAYNSGRKKHKKQIAFYV